MIKKPLPHEFSNLRKPVRVIEYKRDEERNMIVSFDKGFSVAFSEEEFYHYDFYETEEPLRRLPCDLAEEINNGRCYIMGVVLLSSSLKPSGKVRQTLKAAGFSRDTIDTAIEKLEKEEYLADARFAEKYINKKLSEGNTSSGLLKNELIARGIPEDVVAEAIAAVEIDDEALAVKIAEKKKKNGDSNAKIMRYLASKGFGTSLIIRVVGGSFEDNT